MTTSKQIVQVRQPFFNTWQKYQAAQELDPVEKQIIAIILQHKEYHTILDNPKEYLEKDFPASDPFSNPFLHFALHLGLHEQLSTNRPQGIYAIYKKLVRKLKSEHDAEHKMMATLQTEMQTMIKQGPDYDEADYLTKIKQLLSDD